MKVEVFKLNSFAKTADGGNPAGVVLNADGFTEKQMLLIANKAGFSETAFVQKSDKADFKVRFFTPTDEVDLCGHATIAVYSLMYQKALIKAGKYRQETLAGILGIEILEDGTVFMNQKLPEFFGEVGKNEIADLFNISADKFLPDLPAQIVSTGLKDVIVPMKSMEDLYSIKPNFEALSVASKRLGVVGWHVFTFETKFNSTAHCRNFAPLYGINEESATGTATGVLVSYLFKHGRLKCEEGVGNFIFEQGYSMGKPSEIIARLRVNNREIKEVLIGGQATLKEKLELTIDKNITVSNVHT